MTNTEISVLILCLIAVVSCAWAMATQRRKRTEEEIDKNLRLEYENKHQKLKKQNRKWHESEVQKHSERVDEFINKVVKVTYDLHGRGNVCGRRFRCAVEFDERLVHGSLEWGDNQRMTQFLAESISRTVEREVQQINFYRLASEAFGKEMSRR